MSDLDGSTHTKDTWEVTDGYHHHRTESGERRRLRPGETFHPTRKQVAEGSLKNKARKVSEGSVGASTTVDANIGLRALPMTDSALELALEADLSEGDFAGVEPEGANGDYLKSQVEALVEEGAGADGGEG